MTLLEHYEMERKEGLEEGLKKGLKEGLKKGILGAIEIMVEDGRTEQEMTDRLVNEYKINLENAMEYITEWKKQKS